MKSFLKKIEGTETPLLTITKASQEEIQVVVESGIPIPTPYEMMYLWIPLIQLTSVYPICYNGVKQN